MIGTNIEHVGAQCQAGRAARRAETKASNTPIHR
jgi:hypothetical protein